MWVNVIDEQPPPDIKFKSFSPVYGYKTVKYSSNPKSTNTLASLKLSRWMEINHKPYRE